jgi:hypothetical protein
MNNIDPQSSNTGNSEQAQYGSTSKSNFSLNKDNILSDLQDYPNLLKLNQNF